MKMRCWSIGLLLCGPLALAGCEAQAPKPQTKQPQIAAVEQPVMGPERRILAFGDSLFAGYNVDADESYPARLEASLRARGINARVANAGVSGDTSAAGLQRLVFTLDAQAQAPELVILELGGNDLLRGVPVAQVRKNLDAMLGLLKQRSIPVILFGMRAPPNLGADYVGAFDGLYPELAEQYDAALVPFFMEPVYDRPQLIQPDRIHPTARGIEAMVEATIEDVSGALPEVSDEAG